MRGEEEREERRERRDERRETREEREGEGKDLNFEFNALLKCFVVLQIFFPRLGLGKKAVGLVAGAPHLLCFVLPRALGAGKPLQLSSNGESGDDLHVCSTDPMTASASPGEHSSPLHSPAVSLSHTRSSCSHSSRFSAPLPIVVL